MNPIVLLASSRRKGNTGALAEAIAAGLGAEVVDLSALSISAYDYEHRNRGDDFEPLMARLIECSPIVFASPIYWYACAPPMKAFLDRITDYLDLPELLASGRRLRGKDAYVACTSVREEPLEHFLGAFKDTFTYLGMSYRGAVHINCADGYQPTAHDDIARNFVKTIVANSSRRPSMRFELPPYASCSFCDDLSGARECAIVAENEFAMAEIDERQYERGAMLVIPKRHSESVLDIERREIEGLYSLVREVAHAAVKAFGAKGMNIFQNNGAMAGQSEPHFHVHVVPRYEGSDPHKIFMQHDCGVTSMAEQRAIANLIKAAL